jgi:hypothetical protein
MADEMQVSQAKTGDASGCRARGCDPIYRTAHNAKMLHEPANIRSPKK